MNKTYFPKLDIFYDKFCKAVTLSGNERNFTKKWGLDYLADIYNILNNNVQGGYDSHKQTMLAASTNGSVLNLGPGMGFCVFLLTELFERVLVAEPDGENCLLLNSIANHYETHKGKKANEIVKVYHAGISITHEAINYWKAKQELMKKRKLKGSILNFSIEGANELRDTLHQKVSRVYLHKVLSSLSIATDFENIISQCRLFLKDRGQITWSEPGYIFDDILQLNDQQPLEHVLIPIFEKNHLHFHIKNYQVFNRDQKGTQPGSEKWTLINAWRSTNEKR